MFAIGEVIIGKPDNGYCITNYKNICRVIGYEQDGMMIVRVLTGIHTGECYPVDPDGFIRNAPIRPKKDFKIFIKSRVKCVYFINDFVFFIFDENGMKIKVRLDFKLLDKKVLIENIRLGGW